MQIHISHNKKGFLQIKEMEKPEVATRDVL